MKPEHLELYFDSMISGCYKKYSWRLIHLGSDT